ncbi:hypothetical protein C9J85_09445 [Haloferax sp. wsp5]|nr:hypothetical protein C9J85_09445 [Haloferax sp. wsp5]
MSSSQSSIFASRSSTRSRFPSVFALGGRLRFLALAAVSILLLAGFLVVGYRHARRRKSLQQLRGASGALLVRIQPRSFSSTSWTMFERLFSSVDSSSAVSTSSARSRAQTSVRDVLTSVREQLL